MFDITVLFDLWGWGTRTVSSSNKLSNTSKIDASHNVLFTHMYFSKLNFVCGCNNKSILWQMLKISSNHVLRLNSSEECIQEGCLWRRNGSIHTASFVLLTNTVLPFSSHRFWNTFRIAYNTYSVILSMNDVGLTNYFVGCIHHWSYSYVSNRWVLRSADEPCH